MNVLGIETSCDETGVAVYSSERGLLADALYSQIELHAAYGGVVPELASRDHVRKLVPLVKQVLSEAGLEKVDAVAYTQGPGLAGALISGACFGRSLAMGWNVPALGVHHMEGHLLAPLLEASPPTFPFIALLVSGGHTQLVRAQGIGQYQLLGESLDDAAGEAFDKAAKMLGLPYPGGPSLAARAAQGQPKRFRFPRPMTDRPGLDFSFSGLKTYTRNTIQALRDAEALDDQAISDVCVAFQEAVAQTLAIKCERALKQEDQKQLVIAGGVSANTRLREVLQARLKKINARVFYARPALCTDNGAMIAYAGCQRLLANESNGLGVKVRPRWPLSELGKIA